MEKKIKFIKKVVVLFIIFILLLIANRYMVILYGDILEENYKFIISCALTLIFIGELLWIVYDILRIITFKMAERLWNGTLNNLRVGIRQNLSVSEEASNREKTSDVLLIQCFEFLAAYEKVCSKDNLLDELKQRFEDESVSMLDKEEIAYIILSNKTNRSVAEFCSTFQGNEFFLSCERMSQTIIRRSTFMGESINFDSEEFRSITNEFLHIGLAYGTINTDERIDYIRKVLSWVREEIKKKSSIDNQYFQKFISALSKIENNLIYHNLSDELIDTYIKQIKKSWYFRRMYWNANKRLWSKKYHSALKDRVYDIGFIIAYNNKFGVFYRLVLHNIIRNKIKEYRRLYHINYGDAASILILAVPLGSMESPKNDYVDELLTLLDIFGGEE